MFKPYWFFWLFQAVLGVILGLVFSHYHVPAPSLLNVCLIGFACGIFTCWLQLMCRFMLAGQIFRATFGMGIAAVAWSFFHATLWLLSALVGLAVGWILVIWAAAYACAKEEPYQFE